MFEILINDFKQFKYIKDDRNINKKDIALYYIKNPCFRYVVYMRLCKSMADNNRILFPIFRILFRNLLKFQTSHITPYIPYINII